MTVQDQIFRDLVRDGMRRAHKAACVVAKRNPEWTIEVALDAEALDGDRLAQADPGFLPYVRFTLIGPYRKSLDGPAYAVLDRPLEDNFVNMVAELDNKVSGERLKVVSAN